MPVDTQAFKNTLAKWATGVTVVTTKNAQDEPHGMTVSSFTSVSIDPFLILICASQKYYGHTAISDSGVFAVNILSMKQIEWGKLFAGMYPDVEDRFADIDYTSAVTGAPILPDVPGWIDCSVYERHAAGDHTIFVGKVEAVANTDENTPLLYFNRNWGLFTPLNP